MAWDGEKVCSWSRNCALPRLPRGPTRLAGALHPGPLPGLSESVALEESWRGDVWPLQAEKEFPAFPCSLQVRFWPGAVEPRKGRFRERGSARAAQGFFLAVVPGVSTARPGPQHSVLQLRAIRPGRLSTSGPARPFVSKALCL